MAEIMSQLEVLAYLAGRADSVQARRELDELLRLTETQVDASEEAEQLESAISVS
jgi:hypothetical protein